MDTSKQTSANDPQELSPVSPGTDGVDLPDSATDEVDHEVHETTSESDGRSRNLVFVAQDIDESGHDTRDGSGERAVEDIPANNSGNGHQEHAQSGFLGKHVVALSLLGGGGLGDGDGLRLSGLGSSGFHGKE